MRKTRSRWLWLGVLASVSLAGAIIFAASLGFLRLGTQPPTSSWGRMLSIEGRGYTEATPRLVSWTPDHPLAPLADRAQGQDSSPEANLPFLFAVYTITWVTFFGYAFYLSRRQAELRREIQALREELARRKQQPGS